MKKYLKKKKRRRKIKMKRKESMMLEKVIKKQKMTNLSIFQ